MSLDWDTFAANDCDAIKVQILDSVSFVSAHISILYEDTDEIEAVFTDYVLLQNVRNQPIQDAEINFIGDSSAAECVVLSVSYLKGGRVIGSSLVQNGSCELKLLKYKVELPRGAKVTLFDDESLEAKFVAWNIPCPNSLPNMTYLQVKAANGREAQITPSAGSQSFELYTELGRRYAVFGEIWTYSFALTLWLASLKIQLADDSWQDCIPTAGEGGTIVTALPQ